MKFPQAEGFTVSKYRYTGTYTVHTVCSIRTGWHSKISFLKIFRIDLRSTEFFICSVCLRKRIKKKPHVLRRILSMFAVTPVLGQITVNRSKWRQLATRYGRYGLDTACSRYRGFIYMYGGHAKAVQTVASRLPSRPGMI